MQLMLIKIALAIFILSFFLVNASWSADGTESEPLIEITTFAQAREHFFSYYPPAGRAVLNNPSGSINQVPQNLYDAVNDPGKLLHAVCLSLGSTDPRNAWFRDMNLYCHYAIDSVANIEPELFLKTLEQFKAENSESGLLGAAVLFFENRMRYSKTFRKKLPTEDQLRWGKPLAELVLSKPEHYIGYYSVIDGLREFDAPWATAMLTDIAHKNLCITVAPDYTNKGMGTDYSKEIRDKESIVVAAYLALAEKNESSIANEIKDLLSNKLVRTQLTSEELRALVSKEDMQSLRRELALRKSEQLKGINKLALELALVHLGDHTGIKLEFFEDGYDSPIPYSAIRALEKFNGTHGLDLLMTHGFDDSVHGMVGEKIESAINRIIGSELFSPTSNKKRDSRARAKEWWQKNGETFVVERRRDPNYKWGPSLPDPNF